jgi:hypothetical protein
MDAMVLSWLLCFLGRRIEKTWGVETSSRVMKRDSKSNGWMSSIESSSRSFSINYAMILCQAV